MDNKGKEKEEEKHQGTDIEEEEDEDGNKGIVVLGPQVPLKEQLELDKVSHWDSIK
jgi:Rho GDP-dissociation inhibitor